MFQRRRIKALKLYSAHPWLLSECRSNKVFRICRDILIPLRSAGKKKTKTSLPPSYQVYKKGHFDNKKTVFSIEFSKKKNTPTLKLGTDSLCKILASSPPTAF